MNVRTQAVTSRELRSFGLLVGGVFAIIACWPLIVHQEDPRLWALVVSAILATPAILFPRILLPIYKLWMRLGMALGWLNTRIILGLGFYGVFTPTAVVLRLLGRDPLNRKFDPELTSYRVGRTPRPGTHMERQF